MAKRINLTSLRAWRPARSPVEGVRARLGNLECQVVNLEIDPEFSAKAVFDTLRSDPTTAKLPILICARNAWLRPNHRQYIEHKHLNLPLVPFTPEELILTLDRALDDTK